MSAKDINTFGASSFQSGCMLVTGFNFTENWSLLTFGQIIDAKGNFLSPQIALNPNPSYDTMFVLTVPSNLKTSLMYILLAQSGPQTGLCYINAARMTDEGKLGAFVNYTTVEGVILNKNNIMLDNDFVV